MNILWWITLFVLVSQASCSMYIGTGRGAIRAVKIGNSYTLREAPIWENEDGIRWTLEQDARFPNGVFIRSVDYPNLVWDTQAYQFTPGTNVNLWAKKNTLVDTKNQRWVLNSANQLGIIYNTNMVASVSQGKVVLANKGSSQFQKFYPVSDESENMWSATFENFMFVEVEVLVQSVVGNYTFTISSDTSPTGSSFFPGTILTFQTNPPYVYPLTGNNWIVLPPPPSIPVGTPSTWIGSWILDIDPIPIEFTLTFDSNGNFQGVGHADGYGDFVTGGSQTTGLTLGVTFAEEVGSFSFAGVLTNDEDGIRMSGQTRSYDYPEVRGRLTIAMQ